MAQALAEPQERLVEVEATEPVRPEPAPIAEQKAFRAYDPDQVLLMAPVLQDWVPEDDLAHFVSDLVETSLDRARSTPPMSPSAATRPTTRG